MPAIWFAAKVNCASPTSKTPTIPDIKTALGLIERSRAK